MVYLLVVWRIEIWTLTGPGLVEPVSTICHGLKQILDFAGIVAVEIYEKSSRSVVVVDL